MNSNYDAERARTARAAADTSSASSSSSNRFDVLDLARGLAILAMLGSHLVGTDGGATALERGITGVLAAIEPTAGALFCVLAGISWTIQADRVGVTPSFRRYLAGRALALGLFGVVFHLLFWKTEILVPFAMMMALSLVVLGAPARVTATLLLLFLAATPVVLHFVAPYAATDWLEYGVHVADGTVGWVTLRYLFVDGNYPLISWMAFPLMGILFWQTARDRTRTKAWFIASLGVAGVAYAVAAHTAPAGGAEAVRRWIARGWTPTSATFLLTGGGGALVGISALLCRWGTAPLPRVLQPLVLLGRASLSHYVLHIAIPYSMLRLWYPNEDWVPRTGLWALLAYLAITVPIAALWFRRRTHGPFEALLARSSRRPSHRPASDGPEPPASAGEPSSVEIIREAGFASLHAARFFARGEVVFPLRGRPVARPTRFSIQVASDAHLDPISDSASPWGCLNHGCDPNVAIDVPRRAIVARRPIAAGEQLRFDYCTTEWELAEPFVCNCGAATCVGVAMGFAHLSSTRQQILLRDAAPHIRALHAAGRSVVDREVQPVSLGTLRREHSRRRRTNRRYK
jgi:uncharacterized membrane protein YeiB